MFCVHVRTILKQNEHFGSHHRTFGITSFAKLLVLGMIAIGKDNRSRRNFRNPLIWQ
jgi:hypothetical protein